MSFGLVGEYLQGFVEFLYGGLLDFVGSQGHVGYFCPIGQLFFSGFLVVLQCEERCKEQETIIKGPFLSDLARKLRFLLHYIKI